MDDNHLRLLRQKLVDGIAMPLPVLTRRDTWIPRLAGKVLAVIGIRRCGKTSPHGCRTPSFAPLCPDLVVELASPSDEGPGSASALRKKIAPSPRTNCGDLPRKWRSASVAAPADDRDLGGVTALAAINN